MRRAIAAVGSGWGRNRDLIGKFVVGLAIVFIGATAAFALENRREQSTGARHHAARIATLGPVLDHLIQHNAESDAQSCPGSPRSMPPSPPASNPRCRFSMRPIPSDRRPAPGTA